MKKYSILKRFSIVAVAGLLALSSCNKDSETEPEDSTDAQAILVADATASSDAVFVVNAIPQGSNKDSITTAEIPAVITAYLAANYTGYSHLKAFKVKKNSTLEGYVVVIKLNAKPIGLKFDANGTFIKVCEQREKGDLKGKCWKQGGRFDGRDGKHRDTIALTSLPTLVKAYFALNYPKDTLLAAHSEREGGLVVISANNGLYATLFSSSNVFVKRSQLVLHAGKKDEIAQANLPVKISAYLASSYPAFVFHRAFAVKINSTVQAYVVLINSNNTKYALQFDAAGNFVKTIVIK